MSELEKLAADHAKAETRTRYWVLGFMGSLLLAVSGNPVFGSASLTLIAIGCGMICFVGGVVATFREQRAFRVYYAATGLTREQIAQLHNKFYPQD